MGTGLNELGLEEFEVLNKYIDEDGFLCYDVLPKEEPSECPLCFNDNFVKNGTIERLIKDLPSFGRNVCILVRGNRFICKDCNRTFVQSFDCVDDKGKLTKRLKEHVKQRSLSQTLQQIATDYNLSISTVSKLSNEYVDSLEKSRVRYSPRVLGIDEAHLSKEMRGVFADIERHGIIDMTESRSRSMVEHYLNSLPDNDKIEIVTMDMWKPYKEAVNACLPRATVVVDRFHVIKAVLDNLDAKRKELFNKDKESVPVNVKRAKALLLKNFEDLNETDEEDLAKIFVAFPILEELYSDKEILVSIYRCKTRHDAVNMYKAWLNGLSPYSKKVYGPTIKTFNNWNNEIFNYFDYKYTNGVTESLNGVIKSIEKMGRGYSFKMIRARVLYGTSATKKALKNKTKRKPVYHPGVSTWTIITGDTEELIHGDYVDIDELRKVINNEQ